MNADNLLVTIDRVYRQEARRVHATLIRLLQGNFDLAEEALQDAFAAALAQWDRDGIPENPRAWLISAGRFKAIDRLRKRTRLDASLQELTYELELLPNSSELTDGEEIEDDRLRLIFTCCHPSLSPEARVSLTLREVCGLKTEEIAAAFLIPVPTLAQRIVRAKSKIRDAGVPYEVPQGDNLADRLASVLQVIYLVFNEGYSASIGEGVINHDLSSEAMRLVRLLHNLLPEPEVSGLLALMLLHDARRASRTSTGGELIPLEEQDRTLWDREQIAEGCELVLASLKSRRFGAFTLQAAIAAVHAEAPSADQTDWAEIAGLYTALMSFVSTPVVELNRAVALAMRDGPGAGLALIQAILDRGDLRTYHLAHAAMADLYRRQGNIEQAISSYQQALELVQQGPERRYIEKRLVQLK